MSQYDIEGLHDFLLHTPESGLRRVLVDKETMTDCHFNLLMKVVKSGSAEVFAGHFERMDFPKIKMGPAESKIKESFWQDCTKAFLERGILQPLPGGKSAA